jgi:hypothetical protein
MKKYILLFLTLFGALHLEARSEKRRASSVNSLKLRVGQSKEIRGYHEITADPASAVHIARTSRGHEITPRKEEFVVLKFYIDGEEVAEKAVDIRPRAEEPDVSVGFGFSVGHPGYWYDDPWYPFGWHGWHRPYRHRSSGWHFSIGG